MDKQGNKYVEYQGKAYPLEAWQQHLQRLQQSQGEQQSIQNRSMRPDPARFPAGLMGQDNIQPF